MIAPAARPSDEPRHPGMEMSFLTSTGCPMTVSAATFGADAAGWSSPPLVARPATLGEGWELVQHRLPAAAAVHPENRGALEREVGAAVAIARKVAGLPHANRFQALAGYDMDTDEPFVFYDPPCGRPLADWSRQALGVRQRQQVLYGLLGTVRILDAIGLVHGDITPTSVYWDGETVQLGRPRLAASAGAPRRAGGAAPFASAEQRAGIGLADARDDLWSVVQVMYCLLTGQVSTSAGCPADLEAFPALARPMRQVFAGRADDRPQVAQVLQAAGVEDPLIDAALPPDGLDQGRRAFDQQLRVKRGTSDWPAAADGGRREGGENGKPRRRWRPWSADRWDEPPLAGGARR